MRNDAIQRVSKAIAAQIDSALSAVSGQHKVIVAPPSKDNLGVMQIVLFPYKLMVNTALRNTERVLPPAGPQGVPVVFNDALPLDVFYLVTVGTSQPDDLESLVWLGTAMQTLQQNSILAGSPVDGDTVRVSLEPAVLDEMSRVWAMFPDADYRTSVVYVASPVWIDPLSEDVAAPVIDDQRQFGQADGMRPQ
jgi:Pvc16 N-terminal domain